MLLHRTIQIISIKEILNHVTRARKTLFPSLGRRIHMNGKMIDDDLIQNSLESPVWSNTTCKIFVHQSPRKKLVSSSSSRPLQTLRIGKTKIRCFLNIFRRLN